MSTLRSKPEVAVAAGGLFLLCWGLVHLGFWSHGALVAPLPGAPREPPPPAVSPVDEPAAVEA